MILANKILMTCIAIATLANNCAAEQAPISNSTTQENSDAVVVVDVLKATCTAETNHQNNPVYLVTFRVCEVRQGNIGVGQEFVWHMADYQPMLGESDSGGVCYPGERYLLYLKRLPNGNYDPWQEHSFEPIVTVPEDEQHLPTRPGQAVVAFGFNPPLESVSIAPPPASWCWSHRTWKRLKE